MDVYPWIVKRLFTIHGLPYCILFYFCKFGEIYRLLQIKPVKILPLEKESGERVHTKQQLKYLYIKSFGIVIKINSISIFWGNKIVCESQRCFPVRDFFSLD